MSTAANRLILAGAGSGKTSRLLREASDPTSGRVLITTYTRRNAASIEERLRQANAGVPPTNVQVMTWFDFLMRHGARPYQSVLLGVNFISGLDIETSIANDRTPRAVPVRFYTGADRRLLSERLADFVYRTNQVSGGAVMRRIADVYDAVFVDEAQDLAGWHLEVLELLLRSNVKTIIVADPRQATFATSREPKNRQYRYGAVYKWFQLVAKRQLVVVEEMTDNHRSVQSICDFSDAMYPGFSVSRSTVSSSIEHQGIFSISAQHSSSYIDKYKPTVLVWDKRVSVAGALETLNFGEVKGLEFDRVLVKLTTDMESALRSGVSIAKGLTLAKAYVAYTRARYSVTLIAQNPASLGGISQWFPS